MGRISIFFSNFASFSVFVSLSICMCVHAWTVHICVRASMHVNVCMRARSYVIRHTPVGVCVRTCVSTRKRNS